MRAKLIRRVREEVLAVVIAVAVVSLLFGGLYKVFDKALSRWTARDLDNRARLIWRAAASGPRAGLDSRIDDLTRDENVVGMLACFPSSAVVSDRVPPVLACSSPLTRAAIAELGNAVPARIGGHDLHVTAHVLDDGHLVIVQDRTFVEARRERLLQVLLLGGWAAIVATLLLIHFGVLSGRRRAMRATRDLFERIHAGGNVPREVPAELRPVVTDLNDTLRRLRRHPAISGEDGPARLRRLVHTADLGDTSLVVIANREPYEHTHDLDGKVRVKRPPSGLVTGIEPVLRSCGGTWIAHGSGSADRVASDRDGRLPVPPDNPEYVLRRLWLTDEEYDGYYLGFANEGLWPLCHIAHTRPTFRSADWAAYREVNMKFAQAAVAEGDDSVVLVQDYHFALVPRMMRELAPHAAASLFWHIPWPNSEVIGICPWKEEILDGMLGADVLGFHTRFHCLNFLETVQRYLECRVDLAEMSVEYRGQKTLVRPYPISVEWPYPAVSRDEGAKLRKSLGIAPDIHVAVGVDRADYTKGLLERLAAVETLLDTNPDLAGRFMLVQLAAPSRTRIKKYRDLVSDVEETAQRINRRFSTADYKPVHLEVRSFSPDEVRRHYAMADSALVTPLHDGMNLVAKEYVASCVDGNGALVLSTFAGAAQELDGALIVNPYDADAVAAALARAIHMPLAEKKARMNAMREQISRNSIYDWSEKLLHDLVEVRTRRGRLWPRRPDSPRPEAMAG
jgi:trehalose 6-phosphate synthase